MASVSGAGLTLDVSYQELDVPTLLAKVQLPDNFDKVKKQLLKGEYRNVTEQRDVTHTLCRSIHAVTGLTEKSTRFDEVVKKLRSGRWHGASGKPISAVVNIGVGGSDLGPNLGASALKEFADDATLNRLDVYFASSMDGAQLYDVLPKLDPETTLFIIASKSFGTIDTFANVDTVKAWIKPNLTEQQWLNHHVIGVSSNAVKMTDYGIPPAHQFTFGEGVGGRFSLWSAIGLAIALNCGLNTFERILAGARIMDEHFANAKPAANIPLLLALYGIYNRNELGINNLAVLPYDGRLELLPNYLQQLDMESNGKQANSENRAIDYPTGPIIWGGLGPNGQHAFFQHLHQGYDKFTADFVLVLKRLAPGFRAEVVDKLSEQQQLSVANCLAHRQLMKFGSENKQSPRDNYPGGHPSNLLYMEELTPETFGALIAAYEHKVFSQGVYWRINSFDQPGVEMGKKCALDILASLEQSDEPNFDASTNELVKKARL